MSKVTGKGFPLSPVTCLLFPAFCLLSSASQFFTAIPSLSASDPEPGMVQGDGWAATYGGVGKDWAKSICETRDGGYIVAGWTNSFGAGESDVWILKLRPDGTIDWQKTYGGGDKDGATSIQQTNDGGYIVAGWVNSFGAGGGDLWVLKLRPDGTVEWQKTYGGIKWDEANSIQQTSDGGYIVAGQTDSFGAGKGDFWVLKLRPDGTVEWQKTYGGIKWDEANSIQQTGDGGYAVVGRTKSFGKGSFDLWVLKLRPDGTVEWQKTYGWLNDDCAHSIQQTGDGGYIVGGTMAKIRWKFHTQGGVLVLKLRGDGAVEWQKNYRGGYGEAAFAIQQTNDNGYILSGGMGLGGVKETALWVMKLKADGSLEWQRTYGESRWDTARSIQQTSDGGYIVAGVTWSFNGRDDDLWVLRLRSDGSFGHVQDESIGPSCGFIRSTNLFVEDGIALASDTRVMAEESDITPQDSSATVQDTDISARFLVK